jgi:hypothetical protein
MVGGTGRAKQIHGKRRFHAVNLDRKSRADGRGGPFIHSKIYISVLFENPAFQSESRQASVTRITLIKHAEKNVDCRATARK